jgi:sulfur relay protein TusB/DsrH
VFVIIKSPPGSEGAARGIRLAREEAADLLLIGDGVRLARKDMLEGFCGAAFAHSADLRLRGVGEAELEKGVRAVSCEEFVELLAGAEKIAGPF